MKQLIFVLAVLVLLAGCAQQTNQQSAPQSGQIGGERVPLASPQEAGAAPIVNDLPPEPGAPGTAQ